MYQAQRWRIGGERNAVGRFLLVSATKETEAEQNLAPLVPAQTSNVNPFSNSLTLLVEPRLSGNAWFVSASPDALPVPPPSLPDVPLDELDAPDVPLDDPVPAVPAPLVPAPVVPAPVVPPPVPLPLSLLPPPLLGLVDGLVPAAGGTVDNPEFVLLGL